jgi:outer membrane protein TolC
VQKQSFEAAERSYEHDKKALSLGALPPLDIYRSESEVAARRVNVIQIEYSLKQAEDQLRQLLAANRDSAINGLDLELTEKPEPTDTLLQIDIATAMSMALANRPELEAVSQQLAVMRSAFGWRTTIFVPTSNLAASTSPPAWAAINIPPQFRQCYFRPAASVKASARCLD